MKSQYLEFVFENIKHKLKLTIIKRKKLKRLTLRHDNSSSLKVFSPARLPDTHIHNFIQTNIKEILSWNLSDKKIENPLDQRKSFLENKKLALDQVKKHLLKINSSNYFEFDSIRIKDTKSLWGSCSSNKNLNFNFRIVFLPEYLQEYIVLHELCHLYELNHSDRFWNLVSKFDPDFYKKDKELKKIRIRDR